LKEVKLTDPAEKISGFFSSRPEIKAVIKDIEE
jgi:hypothetical protein